MMVTMAEPPDSTLRERVRTSIIASDHLDERDEGVMAVAGYIAGLIDDGMDPVKLTPLLLQALDALQLTPRARARGKGVSSAAGPVANPLDELRERRARRQRPATVDPASP